MYNYEIKEEFYVKLKPFKDKEIEDYLKRSPFSFCLYGIFKIYKNKRGYYQADNKIKIIIDSKLKIASVLYEGELIKYARVYEVQRLPYDIFEYNKLKPFEDFKNTIADIAIDIIKLQKKKNDLIKSRLKYMKDNKITVLLLY